MFFVAFPQFKIDFVIVFQFCIQSFLFWLINVCEKYNPPPVPFILFSVKELCLGSKAVW